jgi:transposase
MALTKKLNVELAADMLRDGASVREVALFFGVSTQAVYLAIKEGRLPKDAA